MVSKAVFTIKACLVGVNSFIKRYVHFEFFKVRDLVVLMISLGFNN